MWNSSQISVDGIFFDEIPGPYDWRKYAYLQTAQEKVKKAPGLGQQVIGISSPLQKPLKFKGLTPQFTTPARSPTEYGTT
jgi:hypothetical protein